MHGATIKIVTDVPFLILEVSRYLCVIHSRVNFMQNIHKYLLPVVVQNILISTGDRSTASSSQDDRAN